MLSASWSTHVCSWLSFWGEFWRFSSKYWRFGGGLVWNLVDLIASVSETNMPDRIPVKGLDMIHRRPICNQHAPIYYSKIYINKQKVYKNKNIETPIRLCRHMFLDSACQSLMGLRSGMLVSNGVSIRWSMSRSSMGIRSPDRIPIMSVFDSSNIFVNSLFRLNKYIYYQE